MKSKLLVSKFEVKSIKEDDPDFFIIEGFASVYGNIDSYRDIVEKGAFSMDLMENGNERPILWQHNSDKPIGIGIFSDSPEGLKVTCKLPKQSEFVKSEVMPMVKCGAVKGMSIGYSVDIEEYDRDSNINHLRALKLRENSIVTFPANQLAQITAAKQILAGCDDKANFKSFQMSGDKESWSESEAISQIKKLTGSESSPSEDYKDCFMFCESGKSDSFEGYHFPYVKNVNGELRLVPNAIFSIAGKMASGKPGVKVSGEAVDIIKKNINIFYEKMGMEAPFKGEKTFINTQTLKNMVSMDRIFDDPDYIISSKAKNFILDSVRRHSDGSLVEEKTDLLDAMKRANSEMEKML